MMVRNTVLAIAILAAAADVAAGVPDHLNPSASLLEQLKRQHDRRNWLRVTSDSLRWEVRAREITPQGLRGITSSAASPPAADPIRWPSIARIDRVETNAVSGFFGGAVVGVALGTVAFGISQNAEANLSPSAIVVTAAIGGLLGTALGRRIKSEHLVYEAPAEGIVGIEDTLDSKPSPEVTRALTKLRLERRLRVEGVFGQYEGYASRLGPQGIEGVRPDPTQPPRPLLESVGWDQITRVEQQGNAASAGAIVGGVAGGISLGSVGALLGAWADSEGGSGGGVVGGAILGALVGTAGGAALGAITGLAIPMWHKVYERH